MSFLLIKYLNRLILVMRAPFPANPHSSLNWKSQIYVIIIFVIQTISIIEGCQNYENSLKHERPCQLLTAILKWIYHDYESIKIIIK
jgi:hypothetical protein